MEIPKNRPWGAGISGDHWVSGKRSAANFSSALAVINLVTDWPVERTLSRHSVG
jgi:hypothetical protein